MSLLGAVAYACQTRLDIAVYVVALQRRLQQSKVIHVKRLNALVRWMQKTPKKIVFKCFPQGPTTLLMLSDSAFKKEEESGHALKGVMYILLPSAAAEPLGRNPGILKTEKGKQYLSSVCHVLEYISRSQKHVTRSTFASELSLIHI